jgi:hypothetical protein
MLFDFTISHPEDGVIRTGQIVYSDRAACKAELLNRIATRKGTDPNTESGFTEDEDGAIVPKYGPEYADACTVELREVKRDG